MFLDRIGFRWVGLLLLVQQQKRLSIHLIENSTENKAKQSKKCKKKKKQNKKQTNAKLCKWSSTIPLHVKPSIYTMYTFVVASLCISISCTVFNSFFSVSCSVVLFWPFQIVIWYLVSVSIFSSHVYEYCCHAFNLTWLHFYFIYYTCIYACLNCTHYLFS